MSTEEDAWRVLMCSPYNIKAMLDGCGLRHCAGCDAKVAISRAGQAEEKLGRIGIILCFVCGPMLPRIDSAEIVPGGDNETTRKVFEALQDELKRRAKNEN